MLPNARKHRETGARAIHCQPGEHSCTRHYKRNKLFGSVWDFVISFICAYNLAHLDAAVVATAVVLLLWLTVLI